MISYRIVGYVGGPGRESSQLPDVTALRSSTRPFILIQRSSERRMSRSPLTPGSDWPCHDDDDGDVVLARRVMIERKRDRRSRDILAMEKGEGE
jgi:hypothetical protein